VSRIRIATEWHYYGYRYAVTEGFAATVRWYGGRWISTRPYGAEKALASEMQRRAIQDKERLRRLDRQVCLSCGSDDLVIATDREAWASAVPWR